MLSRFTQKLLKYYFIFYKSQLEICYFILITSLLEKDENKNDLNLFLLREPDATAPDNKVI